MKSYNKYMDSISVSSALHQKILTRAGHARTMRRTFMIKRYTAAFACLAVIFIGIFISTTFIPSEVTPQPDDIPPVKQPDSTTPVPGASKKYTLDFNRAAGQKDAKIYIPGHAAQELTADDIKAIFPALADTHTIRATANFQNDTNSLSLFNIDANAVAASGRNVYIQIAPGEIALDFVFDTAAKTSDILGTAVTAGYFETGENNKGAGYVLYFAAFKLADASYYVELSGEKAEKEALEHDISELIGLLIEGGAADLDAVAPVDPVLQEERLSLEEARADADFGAYLPPTLPKGFVFEHAARYVDQEHHVLLVNWIKGMGYMDWRVSFLDDNDKGRITSVTNTKTYDLALYPIPRAQSVPSEWREIVDNPIFRIEELTLDAVRARTYAAADSGDDEPGQRMRFGVLYGNVLIELSVKGVSPQDIFETLTAIMRDQM